MPLTFAIAIGMFYLPYVLTSEASVFGYLPRYFNETFNISPLVSTLNRFLDGANLNIPNRLIALSIGAILVAAIWCVLHPVSDGETALRRCILPIGIVTLLSHNLFSWYMLWLLPLTVIFLQPSGTKLKIFALPRIDAWTGWWLFCSLVGLSYTFFIEWKPVNAAIQAQYIPLYLTLSIHLLNMLWKKYALSKSISIRQLSG